MKLADRNLQRGVIWLCVGLAGALLIGYAPALGLNEYSQRWLGACLKVATGAWGGYRISRDIARIDPSAGLNSEASQHSFALLHLARAMIISACVLAVCLAV